MAKRAKQLQFSELGFKRPSDVFGGSLLTSHPKTKRPLDSKYATLVTLRAVRSSMRTPAKYHLVNDAVRDTAKKYGIKIYDFANVGNHIHIALKLTHNRFWAPFIRELTSKIASFFRAKGFWKFRPHTRIIRSWKTAFKNALEYIKLNKAEAEGFIKRSQVKNLKEYRMLFEFAPITMKDPPFKNF